MNSSINSSNSVPLLNPSEFSPSAGSNLQNKNKLRIFLPSILIFVAFIFLLIAIATSSWIEIDFSSGFHYGFFYFYFCLADSCTSVTVDQSVVDNLFKNCDERSDSDCDGYAYSLLYGRIYSAFALSLIGLSIFTMFFSSAHYFQLYFKTSRKLAHYSYFFSIVIGGVAVLNSFLAGGFALLMKSSLSNMFDTSSSLLYGFYFNFLTSVISAIGTMEFTRITGAQRKLQN